MNEQHLLDDMKTRFQDFKCTLQDLRAPTEEFVTNFYCYWLGEFEVYITNINQAQFVQTSIVSSSYDAFSTIIPKVNLLKCIRAFGVVPDFGILDITSPTPRRIQFILKEFINFYQWADFRVQCLNNTQMDKRLSERKANLAEMIKKREDLKKNLNTVIKNIAQIIDKKKQLEDHLSNLQQKTSELKLEKELFKTKTDECSEIIKEKENVLQRIQREEVLVTNKIKEFSHQIVDSPTSLLSDVKVLRAKSDEVKELTEQKRDMVEIKMQSHKKLQKELETQRERGVILDELLKLIDQSREFLQIVSELEKTINSEQGEVKELKSALMVYHNKKQNNQENLQALYLKGKALKSQLLESIESAKRELTEKKEEKNVMIDNLQEDYETQEKIHNFLEKIKQYAEQLSSSYMCLKQQEYEYLEKIEQKLRDDSENLKNDIKKEYPDEE